MRPFSRNYARKPKTAAPNAPPAARTGIPVAAATPFELVELLALVVAAIVEVVFAALACDDVETEALVAEPECWLEVVAVARAAMPRAKIAKNCILHVVVGLIAMYWRAVRAVGGR